ncbi:MAG: type II toxin-antitoxin system RelE/ParE family toxin [Bacteroidetes bacterium]|nr:type II toxin-antitoxin system RelE/ParE family toxin [Bacteroidota bacterium]MBU1371172.1 type II toxin-antitoxin system RelE/ParE family toxin [Bacteroidota bacterium]MBU1486170.1 type II toxin-antitoxin system RelE/ParE family toxin [Bacteroidota bacterium]MBU1761984.1 type II toxin-antitoxin system RelE/ParE family toxin [Bacteroidota bacterium]MBU2046105.1 type II toxin-antitoxin system RelE/ParE family toxin [Bacteroidota bacterium]
MDYFFQFTPKAKKEFIDAYDFYEEQIFGLGDKFRREVYYFVSLIIKNPLSYPLKSKKLREVVLKKFPFIIIYRIEDTNSTIYVSSIFHTKRNPKLK